jgi:hypothetical protein
MQTQFLQMCIVIHPALKLAADFEKDVGYLAVAIGRDHFAYSKVETKDFPRWGQLLRLPAHVSFSDTYEPSQQGNRLNNFWQHHGLIQIPVIGQAFNVGGIVAFFAGAHEDATNRLSRAGEKTRDYRSSLRLVSLHHEQAS